MKSANDASERSILLDALASPDGEVRRLAVEQLSELPIEDAVPLLSERLGDEEWRVRKAAVERLVGFLDHPPVQELLIESLADGDDPGRRNSAFEALVACGDRVTARLVEELANPDVDVRKQVIDAMAAIADPESRGPLVAAVSDADTNVRAAAIEALGVVGGPEEIRVLTETAADSAQDLLVRLSALRALVRLDADVLVVPLGDVVDESVLRPTALSLLGHSSDPNARELLLKGLEAKNRSAREASMGALLRSLGRTDPPSSAHLIESIRAAASDSDVLIDSVCERMESCDLASRMMMIQFLGLLRDRRAVVPMLRSCRDEAVEELAESTLHAQGEIVSDVLCEEWDTLEADLQCRACRVLAQLGDCAAEGLLVRALESTDPELRCAGATGLGKSVFLGRLPDLAGRLEAAARSDEPDREEEVAVLTTAIVAMAERSESVEAGFDVQAIEVLVSRLGGSPEPVRVVIAQVLAGLGRPQDEDVIGYLLKDESASVRRAAVGSLARFPADRSRNALMLALGDESSGVRMAAASVLGDVGGADAINELERLSRDDDPRVAGAAYRATGRLANRIDLEVESAQEIYALLERGLAANPIVALAALDALNEIGRPGSANSALKALESDQPEVVRTAIACIKAHGPIDAIGSLLPLTAHGDWSVRAESARAIADRRYARGLPALLRRLELEDDAFVREVILSAIRELEE